MFEIIADYLNGNVSHLFYATIRDAYRFGTEKYCSVLMKLLLNIEQNI